MDYHNERNYALRAADQRLTNAIVYLIGQYDAKVDSSESSRCHSNAVFILEFASQVIKAERRLLRKVTIHTEGEWLHE